MKHKSYKGNNYRNYKVKDFKGKKSIANRAKVKLKILKKEDI